MSIRDDGASAADDFLRRIADRGVPYLFERSRKFAGGTVDVHRFLTTIALADVGPAFDEWLLGEIVRPLSPPEWRARIHDAAKDCVAVHLGFEVAGDAAGYKIYFEYPLRSAPQDAGGGQPTRLVHRAFKWKADRPDAPVEAHYTWHGTRERPVVRQIDDLFADETSAAPAARIGAAVVALAGARAPGFVPTLLEVREIGSPRCSYDLQFYDAGLRVSDAVTLLRREAAPLGFAPEDIFAALAPVEGARLGHVAAGRDRRGTLFATLYFGPQRR